MHAQATRNPEGHAADEHGVTAGQSAGELFDFEDSCCPRKGELCSAAAMTQKGFSFFQTVAVMLGVLAMASCGSNSTTPSAPTPGPDPVVAVCRNYSSNFTETAVTTQTGFTSMRTYSCAFNNATHALTCTLSVNGVACETNTKQYASTADFVDEVSVIPPRQLLQTDSWARIGTCAVNANQTTTFTYDAQKRVTGTSSSGGGSSTVTAWDAAGRLTAVTGSDGSTTTVTYDASARTMTVTARAVATTTYDANGNITNRTSTANGQSTTYSGSTSQVCK